MTLWIVVGLAALLASLWLALPFLRQGQTDSNEAEHAISIYRDQRAEVERDSRAGLISGAERDAAEQEIERRALRAARRLDPSLSLSRRSPVAAAMVALASVVGAIGLYSLLGTPQAPDQPLQARLDVILERRAATGEPANQAGVQIGKTEEQPESFEGWWALARAHAAAGDHASAVEAYRRAATLSNDDPAVLSAYAEAMTLANGNRVPLAARLIFSQAQGQSNDPRARYYLALAKAQDQDFEGALADWLALYNDSSPEAPWVPLVRRDIVNMARFLEMDLADLLPDASEAELAKAAARVEPLAGVEETAARQAAALEADPKNWEGWIQLARLRAQLGEDEAAESALREGREYFAGAPFVLGKIDEAAQELGLTLQVARGPSDADVAAAGQMTQQQRDDMVLGMVDGLAERLKSDPRDLEGWLMLIRSYAVLQDPESARKAVADAGRTFDSQPAKREQILQLAESLGIAVDR
jgi:cytochrome c-type biogenesis protein CcmH